MISTALHAARLEAEFSVSVARVALEDARIEGDSDRIVEAERQLAFARERCRLLALAGIDPLLLAPSSLKPWA